MKSYYKTLILSIFLITISLSSTQLVYAEAKKTVKVEIENEYKSCTFLLRFENESRYKVFVVSPDGEKYACDKIDETTMRCVVEDVEPGTWKIRATSNELDNIGKISVTVNASKAEDKNVISDIRVGKDIVGLHVFMKDDKVCAKWTDDTCGNVQITVKDLDKNEILDKSKVTEREYECSIPEDVKNISVSVVPSQSAGISGAEKVYTINTSVNDMDAEVILPDTYYVNGDSVQAEVSLNLSYGYQIVDNGIMIAKSEPLDAGFYTIEVPLNEEGEHNIMFYVVDSDGNMESVSASYIKDTIPPEVTLDSEYDGMQVKGDSIVISGMVKDYQELKINEIPVSVATDGRFEVECKLHSGDNEIELVATDAADNEMRFNFFITAEGGRRSSIGTDDRSENPKWKIVFALAVLIIVVIIFKNKSGRKSKTNELGKSMVDDDNSMDELFERVETEQKNFLHDTNEKQTKNVVNKVPNIVRPDKQTKKVKIVKKHQLPGVLKDLIIFSLILAVCVVVFQKVVIIGYTPSESMSPTMKIGDINIGFRGAYRTSQPKRGDIVSFYYEGTKELLCKRIVGLPGETISFSSGYVYIDGELLDESEYLGDDVETNCVDSFEIPEGCYFMMGDNREASYDSRFWENPYISKDFIIGKCVIIFPTHVFQNTEE